MAQETRSDPWVSDKHSGNLDFLDSLPVSDCGKERRPSLQYRAKAGAKLMEPIKEMQSHFILNFAMN